MRLEQKTTEYKGIIIIHLLDGSGFTIKDIERVMLVKRTGDTQYEYKRLFGDHFREDRRYDVVNHRYSKIFANLKSAKEAINAYRIEHPQLELSNANSN